ncbi:EamA-like transporter family protein [Parapedobacter luteus]|uniref:EamA-like transporter family protein n=1 Tax=Parapedobacter luteus TaxID=623280 RepID=A0A1T5FKY4_9SPHI|nr:EamA-like transporter family protein [Parapedobacter luteus]
MTILLGSFARKITIQLKSPLHRFAYFSAGVVFAILWASASAATKIGLQSAQPFVIAIARFAIASAIMLGIAHLVMRQPLPSGKTHWQQLFIYGLFNVSLYLGLYVLAMEEVSAGLGTLFVATNPVLIMLINTLWYRQPVSLSSILSFVLCIAGMLLAAYPLFETSYATWLGIGILFLSMLAYSVGAIYFARRKWDGLHILTINGWQTLIGGVCLLPCLFLSFEYSANTFDVRWWSAVLWLAIPVSVFAVLIWLYLLRDNPIKASAWLFLCPIAGFAIAAILMKEPLSWHTLGGVLLVIAGLYLVQRMRRPGRKRQ